MNKQQGFVLILVIWVLMLLSIIAASFYPLTKVETRSASWLSEKIQWQASTAAGIYHGIAKSITGSKDTRWKADAETHQLFFNAQKIDIKLQQESAQIDLNYAPKKLLQGLIENLAPSADADALSDAIIDWRDSNNEPLANGAEASAYEDAGFSYIPSNRPFPSLDTLSRVIGFNSSLVKKIRPYLTIYSHRPKIDAASASIVALSAIPDISKTLAQQFITARQASVSAELPIDFSLLEPGFNYIDTKSRSKILAVTASITTGYKQPLFTERAIVRIDPRKNSYTLLDWDLISSSLQETE